MARQYRNILRAFPQTGQSDTNDIQTVKQIFPESAFFYQFFQILVRGSNDPDVCLDRLITSNPIEMTIRQYPEQPCLHIQRHVADLVQKQRTAFRLLETASPHDLRSCKGPFFMSEQLGFHQIFRNSGHIERNKRPGGTWTVPV